MDLMAIKGRKAKETHHLTLIVKDSAKKEVVKRK